MSFFSSLNLNKHWVGKIVSALTFVVSDWETPYNVDLPNCFFLLNFPIFFLTFNFSALTSKKKLFRKIVSALTFVVSDWVTTYNWVLPEFLAASPTLMLILSVGTIFYWHFQTLKTSKSKAHFFILEAFKFIYTSLCGQDM